MHLLLCLLLGCENGSEQALVPVQGVDEDEDKFIRRRFCFRSNLLLTAMMITLGAS